ncbi:type 1 glutamine amidotransferase family protein [Nocardia cerradoensis]|uniref:type 1 glutamine amidotransferase family protein n=1 Tax=Nocardia cerradoensis TaxID=85688 RepID=UPI0002FE1927|nr:type 1 glutamine amidotransferase family protein [Nocardia cerradoensis]NKY46733.1 glutamine amidotransferase [Nocardia cerradoensis]
MVETVHLAVYDTFADWEPSFVTAGINRPLMQREPGTWQIRTVGATAEPVTSMGGLRVVPDLTLDQLSPADSAMLVLPGADIWEDERLAPFAGAAAEFLSAGVPVAAICGATYGLAKQGLLDARPHTGNAPENLASTGYSGAGHYVDEPAVTDGDLITASGIAPIDFARHIFARLDLFEPAVLDAWYRLYADRDPSAFFALQAGAVEPA